MSTVPIPNDLTPEEKQSLLRELKEAYFLGALRVRFRERDVTYRSRAEMKAIIDELTNEVAPSPARSTRVIVTSFNRGY